MFDLAMRLTIPCVLQWFNNYEFLLFLKEPYVINHSSSY